LTGRSGELGCNEPHLRCQGVFIPWMGGCPEPRKALLQALTTPQAHHLVAGMCAASCYPLLQLILPRGPGVLLPSELPGHTHGAKGFISSLNFL
jgi:hypothetical protein